MELFLIGLVAFIVSGITLFSGFGLGTVLMPVFAVFFPVPLAIAATALVHFANNIFKFVLMAKHANWRVVGCFSIPATFAALIGATLLNLFDQMPLIGSYVLGGSKFEISVMKIIIGLLIVFFALFELSQWPQKLRLPSKWLPLGGVLSGFFGGLSGNQGALRSVFLLQAGLSRDAFVSTSVVSAILVDISRLMIYGTGFLTIHFTNSQELTFSVVVGTICAIIGTFVGKRFLERVTLKFVRNTVAIVMLLIGFGLIAGFV